MQVRYTIDYKVRSSSSRIWLDIVERFQLSLMLSIIALRNMIEMAGSDIAFLPKSFIRGKSLVDAILSVSWTVPVSA